MRLMGGATAANVDSIPHAGLALVAGYTTGTPDIQWSAADWAKFPSAVHVTIDQGYGAHDMDADIRDVEPGAWTPADAVKLDGWTAARPTIYCDRNDLPAVLAAGWKGDLALAIPEPEPELPPSVPGCDVVAVQFKFNPTWQLWVVFDEHWPQKPPPHSPGQRIIASGVHTVGQIASREGYTVPELITTTVEMQRDKHGVLDPGQRALLDRLGHVHPLPGTVFWT